MLAKKKNKSTANQKYSMLEKRANKLLKQGKNKTVDIDDEDEDDKKEESYFLEHLDRLKELKASGLKGESYDIAVLESLHALVLELIPVAEENYRKIPTHTAASALNQYMSQAREIEADIRALTSFQDRANILVDIIQEEYKVITENMIETIRSVEQRFKKSNNLSRELKECMKEQGEHIKKSREDIGRKVMQMLVSSDSKKSR